MSHGIHDLGSVRRQDQPASGPQSDSDTPNSILGIGRGLGTPEEIRKESFFDMLAFIFCPFYTFMSFTMIVTLVDLMAFFCLLVVDFNEKAYFTPTTMALDTLGAKNAYRMQQDFEIHRWVMPIILHASLSHLIFNVITQLIFGFRLEPSITWKETAIIYVMSGYGGVLMGCLMAPNTLAVGASSAIFGLLTATVNFRQLGYIAARWERLEGHQQLQFTMIWIGFMIVLTLMMSGVTPT